MSEFAKTAKVLLNVHTPFIVHKTLLAFKQFVVQIQLVAQTPFVAQGVVQGVTSRNA